MKGHFLNIGLQVGKTSDLGYEVGELIPYRAVISILDESVKRYKLVNDESLVDEPTLALELYQPLSDQSLIVLMNLFGQKAIPQVVNGIGQMYGSDEWGDFNPEYFIMPDGKRMSKTLIT
jgi:hypothetical protein